MKEIPSQRQIYKIICIFAFFYFILKIKPTDVSIYISEKNRVRLKTYFYDIKYHLILMFLFKFSFLNGSTL